MFFYANGYLCFYHVNRGPGAYRAYQNDEDGFSKLYACRWTPEMKEVDLAKAIVMTLPVVGEMTFAWGQLGQQILTGSNIGGVPLAAPTGSVVLRSFSSSLHCANSLVRLRGLRIL